MMIIVVYNLKGGEGKSKIAYNLALTMGFSIVTNVIASHIDKVFPKNHCLKIFPNEPFPDFDSHDNIIFDLGGFIDERVISVLKKAKWVLVPITNDEDEETTDLGIDSITAFKKYNKNIIAVANRTQKDDYEIIKNSIQKNHDIPVFEISYSTAMRKIIKRRKSIKETAQSNHLLGFSYKKIVQQFDKIINFLT